MKNYKNTAKYRIKKYGLARYLISCRGKLKLTPKEYTNLLDKYQAKYGDIPITEKQAKERREHIKETGTKVTGIWKKPEVKERIGGKYIEIEGEVYIDS